MTFFGKAALVSAVVTLPGMAFAGGYGVAGVKDARVGQFPTETASVWCPKLGAEVPIELRRQMDCDDGVAVGEAKPAVARERFGGRGLFGLPAHVRSGPRSALDDDDEPQITSAPPGGGGDDTPPTSPSDSGEDRDDVPDNDSGSTGKWDRLSDFGVTPDNLHEQSKSFKDAVGAYFEVHRSTGDWSGFNP